MVYTPVGVLPGTLSPPVRVREREALGSNLGIIREIRDMRRISLSFLLGLRDNSAQSYSASPVNNVDKIG